MLIPSDQKIWTLNADGTISPLYYYQQIVIGVAEKDGQQILQLLQQDSQKDTVQKGTTVLYFPSLSLPKYVPFKRTFTLSNK